MKTVHDNFKQVGESLVYNSTDECEVYIPKYYFERGLAEQHGNVFKTLGIFNFRIYKDEKTKNSSKLHIFKFASPIFMTPSSVDKAKLDLYGKGEDEYLVLKFLKDDVFINSLCITKNADEVLKFISTITSGKLPANIPYNELLELWINNIQINGSNLGVSATILELVLSVIYRDKNDLSKPFRFAINKPSTSMLDYKAINLKSVANNNSVFTSVTFEDIDYALTTSVNKLRYNEDETTSPIEKVIKY